MLNYAKIAVTASFSAFYLQISLVVSEILINFEVHKTTPKDPQQ